MSIRVMKIGDNFGAENGVRQALFDNRVQQSMSKLFNKTQQKPNGDKSPEGLEIDWHLANTEQMFDTYVEPVSDYQPSYAYA